MSIAIPSLRAAIAVPVWAKNELWRKAKAAPSLDLRFADNKSLVDATTGAQLVTFSRSSGGTFVGSNGVLQTAANDAPRFDHNPTTGESLGLLVEEQRTNSIRNNTMVGAVAGTPGTAPTNWTSSTAAGITRELVGIGTENGIAYIDYRFSGTGTGNSDTQFDALTASQNQTWTASVYLKVVGGSATNLTIRQVMGEFNSGSFLSATVTDAAVGTGALATQRFSHTRTLSNATVNAVSTTVRIASTGAIDITLRIGLPQLEQGAFATSVIPTTTAAATRNADVASITGTNFSSWYRQDEGTVFTEFNRPAAVTDLRSIAATSDSGFNNRITFRTDSAVAITPFVITGGALQATFPLAINSGAANKAALAYATNDFNAGVNGISGTNDTVGTVPVVDRLSIGSVLGAEPSCCYVRRLTYWPQRLANSTLQTITQ